MRIRPHFFPVERIWLVIDIALVSKYSNDHS